MAFSSEGSNDDLDAAFGGRIIGYAWDFGDGTVSTEANPQKAYSTLSPAEGFLVRLAVFDDGESHNIVGPPGEGDERHFLQGRGALSAAGSGVVTPADR